MYHKPIIVGNWKMYAVSDAHSFCRALPRSSVCRIVLCPPAHLLPQFIQEETDFLWGAQDCSAFSDPDHTGDISAAMLAQIGASYVIIGHSERRHQLSESNTHVAQKVSQAKAAGLIPIVCIGETAQERDAHQTLRVIDAQMANIDAPILAYEPVWAIGKNMPTLPLDALAHVCAHILNTHKGLLLYGGSVKGELVDILFRKLPIHGLLVGSASRQSLSFGEIIEQCHFQVTAKR